MKTYISLLRGINVGGKNIIKMDTLKKICSDIGLLNVKTYIQSGNIVYQSLEQVPSILSNKVQDAILSTLTIEVPVITITIEQFKDILSQHPFTKEEELAQLYITFLSRTPHQAESNTIQEKKAESELLNITTHAVYLVANNGYMKTKITNALIENKLKVTATTRNYRTCLKLIKLAEPI